MGFQAILSIQLAQVLLSYQNLHLFLLLLQIKLKFHLLLNTALRFL